MIDRFEMEEYERIIGGLDSSEADKAYLMELKWTSEELQDIETQEQYEAFGRAQEAIESTIEYKKGLLRPKEWFRTQQGIMWSVLVAARSDWEAETQ